MSSHGLRLVSNALLEGLKASSVPVGDGLVPDSAGLPPGRTDPFRPYAVLHHVIGGTSNGSLEDPDADFDQTYQITSVGATREQCEWVADEMREIMLASAPSVDGRTVLLVGIQYLGGAVRDDSLGFTDPPVWMCADRYRVRSTP